LRTKRKSRSCVLGRTARTTSGDHRGALWPDVLEQLDEPARRKIGSIGIRTRRFAPPGKPEFQIARMRHPVRARAARWAIAQWARSAGAPDAGRPHGRDLAGLTGITVGKELDQSDRATSAGIAYHWSRTAFKESICLKDPRLGEGGQKADR